MERELLISLITDSYNIAVAASIAVLFIVAIILKLTSNKDYIKSLIEKKRSRRQLLAFVSQDLGVLGEDLNILLNDLYTIKNYNSIHIDRYIKHLQRAENIYESIDILEDEELIAWITDVLECSENIANRVLTVEQNDREVKEIYHHFIAEGLNRTKYCRISDKDYVVQLDEKTKEVKRLIEEFKREREFIYTGIQNLLREMNQLSTRIEKYKKHNIDHKKFLLRHLTFV